MPVVVPDKYTLPDPACSSGYSWEQIQQIMGAFLPFFQRWMNGQTQAICDGKRYNNETKQLEQSCVIAHGTVTYSCDVKLFMDQLTRRTPQVFD